MSKLKINFYIRFFVIAMIYQKAVLSASKPNNIAL